MQLVSRTCYLAFLQSGLLAVLLSLLLSGSSEAQIPGHPIAGYADRLSVQPGKVIRFPDNVKDEHGDTCKIPHMGWNRVNQQKPHALWKNIEDGARFYFVHSYYVQVQNDGDSAAKTNYATEFTSAVAKKNVFATQFHPEKSSKAGEKILENFLKLELPS